MTDTNWEYKFDSNFIFDEFDNTGLQILGVRILNRPADDSDIKAFIKEMVITELIEDIPDQYETADDRGELLVSLRSLKQQLRKDWLC